MANLLDFSTAVNPVRGDGITDTTPAFNAALVALAASTTDRTLILPAGHFIFCTKPSDITFSLKMHGQGATVTSLVRGFADTGNGFIKCTGGNEMYNGGAVNFADFNIDAGGFTGGVAMWLQAPVEQAGLLKGPHASILQNVYTIAGFNYPNPVGNWLDGFYLDGSLNIQPPGPVAFGIRNICMMNCSASQYTDYPILGYNTAGCRFVGKFDGWVNLGATNKIHLVADQGSINLTNWPMETA